MHCAPTRRAPASPSWAWRSACSSSSPCPRWCAASTSPSGATWRRPAPRRSTCTGAHRRVQRLRRHRRHLPGAPQTRRSPWRSRGDRAPAQHPRRHGTHRHRRSFTGQGQGIRCAGMEVYTPQRTEIDGGESIPAGRSPTPRTPLVRGRARERQARRAAFGESEPFDKVIKIDDVEFTVIGFYRLHRHPMGTPTSAGGATPKANRSLRERPPPPQPLMAATKPHREAVHTGVAVEEAVDDVHGLVRGQRGLRPSQPNNFDIVTQDRFVGDLPEAVRHLLRRRPRPLFGGTARRGVASWRS